MFKSVYQTIVVGVLFSVLYCGASSANSLPKVTAKAWLVADDTGHVIEGINTKDVRSIASISKLMTAMVILDAKLPLDEVLTLRKQSITRLEVLQLAVTHSDNEAALLLCETYPKGYHACIHDMNSKADQLGMMNTNFIEPTGLSVFNVSTAEELVKLVTAASKYPEIVQASNSPIVKIKVSNKGQNNE